MFTKGIVKTPCKAMIHGLTTAGLGKPDYDLALAQHQGYIKALERCGLEVTVLPADEGFPDSTFIEDAALITPNCAVITNPGAVSRRDEVAAIREAVRQFYPRLEQITPPGTLDAGDVMMVGKHFYIGLSKRTNSEGARQLTAILERHGMTGATVSLETVLHLKTGVTYLEDNTLLATGEFRAKDEFRQFRILEVDEDESYAANSVWVNGYVITPQGFPKTLAKIKSAGYEAIEVDVSEFRKLDGGLSCLSLRF